MPKSPFLSNIFYTIEVFLFDLSHKYLIYIALFSTKKRAGAETADCFLHDLDPTSLTLMMIWSRSIVYYVPLPLPPFVVSGLRTFPWLMVVVQDR